MSKKIFPVALLSGLTLIGGIAFAANPVYPINPEQSFTTLGVPAAKTRAEVVTELAAFRRTPVSADGWEYVGGERGWALLPHTFDFVGGKLTHSDQFDHGGPKPTLSMSGEENHLSRNLYKNTF